MSVGVLDDKIFIPLKDHEISRMRLQHILTDSQLKLARELKQKLINLQYSEAKNIIDWIHDEILYKEKTCL